MSSTESKHPADNEAESLRQRALEALHKHFPSYKPAYAAGPGALGMMPQKETIRLGDLIDLHELRNMGEMHYKATGIPLGLVDALDGEVRLEVGWQDICLNFHRANPESHKLCVQSDTHITNRISDGEACSYKCPHGLWDIGIPIMVNGVHLATLFLGQFFQSGEVPDRDYFREQARTYGYDEGAYQIGRAHV
mgnify:CR=1 FL=1